MLRNVGSASENTGGVRVNLPPLKGELLGAAVRHGTEVLQAAGVPSPQADAELLAAHLLASNSEPNSTGLDLGVNGATRGQVQRLSLLGHHLNPDEAKRYAELIARRARRVPLQHITGVAAFHRIELKVGAGVFIPRPETELLVEEALNVLGGYPQGSQPRVVDLCTGSGAIAAAVKNAHSRSVVFAVELSQQAVSWARKNCEPYGVHVVPGDARTALEELCGFFDVVLSNPPYIPSEHSSHSPEVAEYDPQLALYGGGVDGLRLPVAVATRAMYLLRPGGFFMMEHDETQQDALMTVLGRLGFERVRGIRDMNGKPRHIAAYKPV